MFWQRTISAAILIAIVLSGFLSANRGVRMIPIAFLIAVAFLGVREACNILRKMGVVAGKGIVFAATACLCASAALGQMEHVPLILAAAFWGAFILKMKSDHPNFAGSMSGVAGTMFVLLWVGLPLAMALDLYVSRGLSATERFEGRRWLKLLLAVVWTTDSFAYLAGKTARSMGKFHLFSRISPKKTWEGAIGGFLGGGVLIPIALALLVPKAYPPAKLWVELVPVSCGLSILTQIGDLTESLIKREADVKDSGETYTGHGGVLDIIDGLLFASAGLWCYVWLVHRDLLS